MFNDYKEQYTKAQERQQERQKDTVRPVYVGTGSVKTLGINPTKGQLTEIIGEVADKFDTTYQKTPDQYNDNKMSRSINFWFTDVESKVSPTLQSIRLVDTPRLSREGKPQYWTMMRGTNTNGEWAILSTKWSNDVEVGKTYDRVAKSGNPYTEEILAPVRLGEENYYKWLKVATKFPNDEEFLEAMKSESLDFDSVFEGNYEGLHKLVEFLNAPQMIEQRDEETGETTQVEMEDIKTFLGIFTAKIKDDGQVRQSFSMNSETWFVDNYGKYTKGMTDRVLELKQARLVRDGMDIIKDRYTLDPLVEYSEEAVKDASIPDVGGDDDFDWS